MIIRPMFLDDCEYFDNLSRKYFPQFDSPDFKRGFFSKFVVADSDSTRLIGCGLRKAAEVIISTDIRQDNIKLGRALVETLGNCVNIARSNGIDFLYAFCENPAYEKHLVQHGFIRVEGNPLSLWVKQHGR